MSRSSLVLATAACLSLVAGSLAQPPKDTKPATPAATPAGQPPLPPGWSEADMKACTDAATPGPEHAQLAKSVGTWTGKNKMWMAPGAPVMESECSATVTSFMDGRFVKVEVTGDMGGMPFNGFGINGFDNVSKKYQSTWLDSCGTGIMTGTGEASADGKTMTWNFTGYCPITKKPVTMRQIERYTGKDTMTLEMYGPEPKTGKEYKVMEISYTRKAGTAAPITTKPGTTAK